MAKEKCYWFAPTKGIFFFTSIVFCSGSRKFSLFVMLATSSIIIFSFFFFYKCLKSQEKKLQDGMQKLHDMVALAHKKVLAKPQDCPPLNFSVVYFSSISLSHVDLGFFFSEQLGVLTTSGASACASSIDVILSPFVAFNATGDDGFFIRFNLVAALIRDMLPQAEITVYPRNHYEYPPLNRVWELGHSLPPNDIVLYFHGKGMTSSSSVPRASVNTALTEMVVGDWKRILQRFYVDKEVVTAGYASSLWGWQWINFFWVRASHVRLITPPVINPRRHYYEDWLSRRIIPRYANQTMDQSNDLEKGYFWGAEGALSLCAGSDPLEINLGLFFEPKDFNKCVRGRR
jgi:hypothetical protein